MLLVEHISHVWRSGIYWEGALQARFLQLLAALMQALGRMRTRSLLAKVKDLPLGMDMLKIGPVHLRFTRPR